MLIKLDNLIKEERCPICNEWIIIELDSDGSERTWIHNVYRRYNCKCNCSILVILDSNYEIRIEEIEKSDEDVMLESYINKEKKEG